MTTNNLLNKIDSLEKILKELKKDVLQQPASNNNHLEVLQHLLNSQFKKLTLTELLIFYKLFYH